VEHRNHDSPKHEKKESGPFPNEQPEGTVKKGEKNIIKKGDRNRSNDWVLGGPVQIGTPNSRRPPVSRSGAGSPVDVPSGNDKKNAQRKGAASRRKTKAIATSRGSQGRQPRLWKSSTDNAGPVGWTIKREKSVAQKSYETIVPKGNTPTAVIRGSFKKS